MMSKKQEFLHKEQSRDKHPERVMKGSAAEQTAQKLRGQAKGNPADHQQPGSGKVANDHNKQGEQPPTQANEGQRTPQSRHDRESRIGSTNQPQSQRPRGPGSGQR